MIEVNNLIKKFDDFYALNGVNMNVGEGEIYGLVGPNGAGKSTLIRHLTGVYRQDAGEIYIDGEEVYGSKELGSVSHIIDHEGEHQSKANLYNKCNHDHDAGVLQTGPYLCILKQHDIVGIPGIIPFSCCKPQCSDRLEAVQDIHEERIVEVYSHEQKGRD